MGYLSEFRVNWQALAAATAGLAGGLGIKTYTAGIFAPHLIAEFAWSKADFALISTTSTLTMICVPLAGRVTDLVGVRRTALIGVISIPLCFLAFSLMTGSFLMYYGLYALMTVLGATTTSAVYSRLIAERFKNARGMAFAIVICAPAAVSAISTPILTDIIEADGWRTGFRALAVLTAIMGALALMLIPARAPNHVKAPPRRTTEDYRLILTAVPFWLIFGGMFLCNIAQVIPSSQLNLIMTERGLSNVTAGWIVSAYATSNIMGRFIFGYCLDRMQPHIVATVGMGLPAFGLFALATGADATTVVAASVILMGLSQGAEGDLMAFLVARYFKIDLYSSTLGLIVGVMGLATSVGSLILSFTLRISDTFTIFLYLCSVSVIAGSAMFLLLAGRSAVADAAQPQQA